MVYQFSSQIPKPPKRLEEEIILPTLYLEQGTKLEMAEEESSLYLRHPSLKYEESLLAMESIRAVIAFEPVEFDAGVLSWLMRSYIPVTIFSTEGALLGRIEPNYPIKPGSIKAQALMSDEQKTHIMARSVWAILRRYRRFLMRSMGGLGSEENIKEVCEELKLLINLVVRQDSVSSLQGLLGRGMFLYYSALPYCLNNDWKFESRNDNSPFNRMLDFAYTLLAQSVKTGIYAAGLNPYLGFWHESYRHQEGLVADLTSEMKVFADGVVVRVLNWGLVVPKDFDDWNNGLPAMAVKRITDSFAQKMRGTFTYPHTKLKCSYQELPYIQAKMISWFLSGEIDQYYSMDLK